MTGFINHIAARIFNWLERRGTQAGRYPPSGLTSIVLHPEFRTTASMGDSLNRLAWALPDALPSGFEIYASCTQSEPDRGRLDLQALNIPESHEDYLSNSHLGQAIHWVDSDTRGELLRAADRILVWNARHWWRRSLLTQARKVSFSDPSFFKETEAVTTASLSYALMSQAQRKTLRDTHLDRFQRLVERLAENETAYAFFTGPSLKEGLRNPLREDSVRLVCNSLVRDESALAIIRPDVIAFSDPAYHFGVSRYAAEFRRHVIKALNRFEDSVCVVPERYAPLMAKAIPAALEERLIGIPDSPKGPFNLPTLERFFVRETGNVLTHLMVPLASSLADEIYVLGADGREGGERGFWKHLLSAQFEGLLKTLADAHPSIARDTDIAAYYRLHCRLTEELLQVGERRWGKRYVSSTPSFIPALSHREG